MVNKKRIAAWHETGARFTGIKGRMPLPVSVCFRHGCIIAGGWEGRANIIIPTSEGKTLLLRTVVSGDIVSIGKSVVFGVYLVIVKNVSFHQIASVFLSGG